MIFIKKIISSKVLGKSKQFNFYKNNYEEILEENNSLKKQLKSLNKKNLILDKKIVHYSKIIDEIKEGYIFNSQNDNGNKRKLLFVLHSGSGGTPKTVNDLAENIFNDFDCYMLLSDRKFMKLYLYSDNEFKEIESCELYSNWLIENSYNDEYSNIYFRFLIKYSFDIVHIHHLIFHTFDLPKLCNQLGIPVILSVHDLYFICPAYTLLDGDFKYCNGDCNNSNTDKDCFMPMEGITNINSMKTFVTQWRELVSEMFLNIDYFIMPSEFILGIIQENYEISDTKISIIEHGIDFDKPNKELFEVPNINQPTKILFLGNLYPQKGVSIIKELHNIDKNNHFEFHFLGFAPSELSKCGVNHGKYHNDQLMEYVEQIKPSFIGIFTLCGESYCYTLSEAWSLGIPVLVSEIGALKERLLKNGGGWFINVDNMHETYKMILDIIKDSREYKSKQNDIDNIKLNSTEFMSEKYLDIYKYF